MAWWGRWGPQADPAIAENCATGQQILLPESPAKTLDNDLLFADELIHEQAPGGIAGFDHDDDAVLGLDGSRSRPEVVTQAE
jgi:hypothetical protein